MEELYRIYDERSDETLFLGSKLECMKAISLIDEDDEKFEYVWIENLEKAGDFK